MVFAHLAEVLLQQVEGTCVVLRRGKGATRSSGHQVLTWPAGVLVQLEPQDLLALPVQLPGRYGSAALLLGWERPIDHELSYGTAAPDASALTAADVAELRRLAQFLGYGLLGDPTHAGHVARVCRHLSMVPAALSLHDLVACCLDGLQDLVLSKFEIHGQMILTAVHGVAGPAVLFALRGGGGAATTNNNNASGCCNSLLTCPSDAQAQMNMLLSGSCVFNANSSHVAMRAMAAAGAAAAGPVAGDAGGPNSTGNNSVIHCSVSAHPAVCGSALPDQTSRIKATKITLAHTLLLQAIRSGLEMTSSVACLAQAGSSTRVDTLGDGSMSCSTYDGAPQDSRKIASSTGCSGRTQAAPPGVPAGGATGSSVSASGPAAWPRLSHAIVPNASSHMLEDQQPCRDLLLCSKLTSVKAGSIVLLVEAAGRRGSAANAGASGVGVAGASARPGSGTGLPDGAATMAARAQSPAGRLLGGRAAAAALASGPALGGVSGHGSGVAEDARAGAGGSSFEVGGGHAVRHGYPAPPSGSSSAPPQTSGAPAPMRTLQLHQMHQVQQQQQRHPTSSFQLGVYLLVSDVLPSGVLKMVVQELQALLPMFFAAFHATLAAAAETEGSSLATEWRRLQEQLLGQPPAGGTGPDSSSTGPPSNPPPNAPPGTLGDHVLRRNLAYESPVQSPVSPVHTLRSGASSRLFKAGSPLPPQQSTPTPAPQAPSPSPAGGPESSRDLAPGGGKATAKGLAVSHGGGMIRKGMMALMAAREEAGLAAHHALSTPGSGGGKGLPLPAAVDSPQIHSVCDARAGYDGLRGFGGPAGGGGGAWRLGSLPQVTLERAAGPSALGTLVNSIRQGLTAAGTDESDECAAQMQDLAAVQLLEVLGRGGQGVVFRGTMHGLETAIKVLTDSSNSAPGPDEDNNNNQRQAQPPAGAGGADADGDADGGPAEPGAGPSAGKGSGGTDTWGVDGKEGEARIRQAKRGAMEVAVIGTLSHPSIVQVYATFSGVVVVRCQYNDSPRAEMRLCFPHDEVLAGKDPGPLNQVICLEYCDAGTLLLAARSGAFRQPFAVAANGAAFPALVPLYKSLLEIALALRYLHARKLVHCDLKAANVLLKSSSRDPRGWTCKLSDFGCARVLTEPAVEGGPAVGFRTAAPVGTLAHMSPECFIKNSLLTPAVDIYSFGVLMWELLMCRTPYSGMNAKDVPRQVIRHSLRPSFNPLAPSEYCGLAARCWSAKPERRPSAMDLVGLLEQLLMDAQAAAAKETHVAATAAATASMAANGAANGNGNGISRASVPRAAADPGRLQPPPPPQPQHRGGVFGGAGPCDAPYPRQLPGGAGPWEGPQKQLPGATAAQLGKAVAAAAGAPPARLTSPRARKPEGGVAAVPGHGHGHGHCGNRVLLHGMPEEAGGVAGPRGPVEFPGGAGAEAALGPAGTAGESPSAIYLLPFTEQGAGSLT